MHSLHGHCERQLTREKTTRSNIFGVLHFRRVTFSALHFSADRVFAAAAPAFRSGRQQLVVAVLVAVALAANVLLALVMG